MFELLAVYLIWVISHETRAVADDTRRIDEHDRRLTALERQAAELRDGEDR